jgi:hypothetical protein
MLQGNELGQIVADGLKPAAQELGTQFLLEIEEDRRKKIRAGSPRAG